ncbi:MAG: YggS family pyridoxal phosphate-dependent enzyme [Opitutae bacterium]|nr:YggS family pyridoxal phosphate-dependent enzyme [Opitutae bacterium]|tara:strand:+ start:460 stop:1167 length:708 start_codon:yes stop_codon:yes gene_type:complete
MNELIDERLFLENLALVRERITSACADCGRSPSEVRVLPITKTFPLGAAEYALRSGYPVVGENRVQEALSKMETAPPELQWELVGHLQSNKAKVAAGRFDRIQSVDSVKLLRRLNAAMESEGASQRILLQVNAGEDPAKFGVLPQEAEALLEEGLSLPCIEVEGLMTIAPFSSDPDVARRAFARLREVGNRLAESSGASLPELSMGMSGDLEAAVAEGSTLLRLGSAFFGDRVSH